KGRTCRERVGTPPLPKPAAQRSGTRYPDRSPPPVDPGWRKAAGTTQAKAPYPPSIGPAAPPGRRPSPSKKDPSEGRDGRRSAPPGRGCPFRNRENRGIGHG